MNRSERRKVVGINKRGEHKKGKTLLLVIGRHMWKQFPQTIVMKSGQTRQIYHTQFVR